MIRLGLRAYFILSFLIFALFISAVCGGLWIASDQLEETATEMNDTVKGIASAQAVLEGLEIHRRQSLLQGLSDKADRDKRRQGIEHDIESALAALEGFNISEREHDLAEVARNDVNAYLTESARFENEGVHGLSLFVKTSPSYDSALSSILDLNRFNQQAALDIERVAVEKGGLYKHWSMVVTIAVIAGLGMLIWFFHHFLYLPLMETRRSIKRFSEDQHVPEKVPRALREIHEIAHAFQQLTDTLKRQNEQRLIFLAAVAHDLKNPLGAIQMSCEILMDSEHDGQNQGDLIRIVGRQAAQLRRLVDDLLNAARIEAGQMELRKSVLDVRDIVRDSVMLFQSLSTIHTIDLRLPENRIIADCDGVRLGQVFNNLLSNAIKYSPKGGAVMVEMKSKGSSVSVSFRDPGIGIPANEFKSIFEPFRRPSASRHQIPGVGLGLSTSKKIVEGHGGTLEVFSQMGEGTEFIVTLPLRA